ncbi:MAG: glycosyltransferase family 4 protein [Flavobacteriales bacterium]|nr:glycosyltransferase family 4 protein [Flavobacteriales bacterium]
MPGYRAGGPIQSLANLVENLIDEFKFSIVTRNTDYLQSEPYPDLVSDQWIDQGRLRLRYISNAKLNYANIRKLLLEQEYDIVYINSMFSYYFTLLPLWILRGRGKEIILAPRGMLAASALGIKPMRKRIFLFICSALGLFRNIRFQATSEQEVKDLQVVFGSGSSIKFAPNIPALVPDLLDEAREKLAGSVNLVSVARISPEKNLLYALNILRRVKGKVQFDIYGGVYAEQYWKSCKELIDAMPENITITVHHGVNRSELFPLLQRSHFLFLPSQGENFGHIIMESLACGCPVIISDQTPWRKLEISNVGYDIDLGLETEFIETIEACVDMDQDEYNQKSSSAWKFAKSYAENNDSIQQSKELLRPGLST